MRRDQRFVIARVEDETGPITFTPSNGRGARVIEAPESALGWKLRVRGQRADTPLGRFGPRVTTATPELEIEGEMRGDAALSRDVLEREFPESNLRNEANVLVMPNVDSANISFNLLRTAAGNGIAVGGILLGAAKPVHIMTNSSTVRRIVNMTAVAVMDAATAERGER